MGSFLNIMLFSFVICIICVFDQSWVQARQEPACAAAGGTCKKESDRCPSGKFVSRLCPTQPHDVKCCVPRSSGSVKQEPACAAAGGTCKKESDRCSSGKFVSRLCPTQPHDVKCCVARSGGSGGGEKFGIICGSNAIRGKDSQGSGSYGSPRKRKGGREPHQGIDIKCSDGNNVYAPFDGKITRRAPPGSKAACVNDGLELEGSGTWSGYTAKMFYVQPISGSIGRSVRQGDRIGTHLGLACAYGTSMTDHVHLELRKGGNLVNPTSFV